MAHVIAHRGASAYALENTIEAFRLAVEMGADGVELDVHGTRDGELVVHHDDRIQDSKISDTDLEVLLQLRLDDGTAIPTLDQALQEIGNKVTAYIEVKNLPPSHDAQLFARIGRAPCRCQVHSFDHRLIKRLRQQRSDIEYGVLSVSILVHPQSQWLDTGASILWQAQGFLDAQLIDAAHADDVRVFAWTTDDASEMKELIASGVDAICTNKPDVGKRIV